MNTKLGAGRASRRWQDIRAKAIDANFDSDRRRAGERVAILLRWVFLIVLGALNNLNPNTSTEAKVTIDLVLGGWGVMNVLVQVLIARGYRPGKQFGLSTMILDILFSAGLVYLSNGFSSPFFLALFLAVITNAVRFGATASFLSALVISFIYLFIGGSFTSSNVYIDPNATIGKIFLFLVVALATGYTTRELERERRAAVERAAEADSLRELSMNMATDTDIKDVFEVLVDNAVQMTSAGRGRLILWAEDGFAVAATASSDGSGPGAADDEVVDESVLSETAGTGEAVFTTDHKSILVPVGSSDGVTAILFLSHAKGAFSNQDLFAVHALSGSSAVPIANALRYHRTRWEATTDGLTGLTNAREFRRRLETALAEPNRRNKPVALLLIDFDHFKSVNDQLGHQRGDLILQTGAQLVRSVARANDMTARYGGDELAVLAIDTNVAGTQRLAQRIVDAVHAAAVPTVAGQHLTFSIGVAAYPDDALTAGELLAAADQALYLAKREGKDTARTFADLVGELNRAITDLEAMLVEAGPQVMGAVAHAVDGRNPVARGHSSRVVAISETLGKHAGVSPADLEELRAAAFVHDVGHVALAGRAREFEAPGHAEAGGDIVAHAKFAPDIAEAVRHHHDRWDGASSVDGLAGVQIPLLARILAVTERYEAMTAGRACARLSARDALTVIGEGSGSEFDPGVVVALRRCVGDGSLELNLPDAALPGAALGPGELAPQPATTML